MWYLLAVKHRAGMWQLGKSEHIVECSCGFDKLYVVSKASSGIDALPAAAVASLRKLGGDLATARKRRRQSLRAWSLRLQVSVPTLVRMEKGDPAVSVGVYATALWLLNRHDSLAATADPKEDLSALEAEVRVANQRGISSAGNDG